MRSFYDRLFHAITLYSDHIGTRCGVWTYQPIEGRRRKTVTDPFRLIGFLYPPRLLAALDDDLTLAEQLASTDKVKTRLALVRTEFEYLRHLARVVHLYHAYEIQPDAASQAEGPMSRSIAGLSQWWQSQFLERPPPAGDEFAKDLEA